MEESHAPDPLRSVLLTVAVLNGGCDRNLTQPSHTPSLLNANLVVTGITDLGTPGSASGCFWHQ